VAVLLAGKPVQALLNLLLTLLFWLPGVIYAILVVNGHKADKRAEKYRPASRRGWTSQFSRSGGWLSSPWQRLDGRPRITGGQAASARTILDTPGRSDSILEPAISGHRRTPSANALAWMLREETWRVDNERKTRMTAEETTLITQRHFQLLWDRAVEARRAGREDEAAAIRAEMHRYRDWLAARATAQARVLKAVEAFETAWEADARDEETLEEAVTRRPELQPLLDDWEAAERAQATVEAAKPAADSGDRLDT
jgi:hypothetical protein